MAEYTPMGQQPCKAPSFDCEKYKKLTKIVVRTQQSLIRSIQQYDDYPTTIDILGTVYDSFLDQVERGDFIEAHATLADVSGAVEVASTFDSGDSFSKTLAKSLRINHNAMQQNLLDNLKKVCKREEPKQTKRLHPECSDCTHEASAGVLGHLSKSGTIEGLNELTGRKCYLDMPHKVYKDPYTKYEEKEKKSIMCKRLMCCRFKQFSQDFHARVHQAHRFALFDPDSLLSLYMVYPNATFEYEPKMDNMTYFQRGQYMISREFEEARRNKEVKNLYQTHDSTDSEGECYGPEDEKNAPLFDEYGKELP